MEKSEFDLIPIIERVEIGRCKFAIRMVSIFWSAQVTDCPYRKNRITGIAIARESREELQSAMEQWSKELANKRLCDAYAAPEDLCGVPEDEHWSEAH